MNEMPRASLKSAFIAALRITAVGVVLALMISLLSGCSAKAGDNYAFYIKSESGSLVDGEILFTDLKKDSKARQITSNYINFDDDESLIDVGGGELIGENEFISRFVYVSKDGKYVFYPDKCGENEAGFNLYYKELADPDAEPIKIDSGIRGYAVNDSATLVTYVKCADKTSNRSIYQYSVTDDSKEKIASEISSVEYITEDLSTVYYVKNDGLYKQVVGNDKEKIANNVHSVINVYASGEIYYWTSETKEVNAMDYIVDDVKEEDASAIEPEIPDYRESPSRPSRWVYDTSEEYDIAYSAYKTAYEEWEAECDNLTENYKAALEEYKAKQSRDEMRAELDGETLNATCFSLCFYNGTEETVIAKDAYIGIGEYIYNITYSTDFAFNVPVIAYPVEDPSTREKVKLSEMEPFDGIEELERMIGSASSPSSTRYVAVKGTTTVVEQANDAVGFSINPSGTVAYFIKDVQEEEMCGELYRIPITKGSVGKAELYDSDVYTGYCSFISDEDFLYFKDCNYEGDMFINKTRIDYDVVLYDGNNNDYLNMQRSHYYADDWELFYYTDWNENGYGTLKFYDGKKAEKIADDVQSAAFTPAGSIVYLCDYSNNSSTGELREWADGETRRIDDDVFSILPFCSTNDRALTLNW